MPTGETPQLTTINSKDIVTYRKHSLNLKATDSLSISRTSLHDFIASKRFAKICRKERAYCLVLKVLYEDTNSIPPFYIKYLDVFDTEAAGIILEHYLIEHKIDLKLSAKPLSGPIYLLLENELRVLREYLETSEVKG
jgi:hypothetical protein